VSAKEAVFDEELRRFYFGEQRVFYTYMKDYLERHPEVKQDSGRFIRSFEVSDLMFVELVKLSGDLHVKVSASCMERNRQLFKFILKRDLAYLIWGEAVRLKINIKRIRNFRRLFVISPKLKPSCLFTNHPQPLSVFSKNNLFSQKFMLTE